jgi:hypothetical protein
VQCRYWYTVVTAHRLSQTNETPNANSPTTHHPHDAEKVEICLANSVLWRHKRRVLALLLVARLSECAYLCLALPSIYGRARRLLRASSVIRTVSISVDLWSAFKLLSARWSVFPHSPRLITPRSWITSSHKNWSHTLDRNPRPSCVAQQACWSTYSGNWIPL